jgi:hypothetical protein
MWHAGERGAYKISCKKLSVDWWMILKYIVKEEDLFCMCVWLSKGTDGGCLGSQ